MSKLGQFYTKSAFSDLLISNIGFDAPSNVLELGAGQGSLLKSAVNRWGDANFIATEIDLNNIAHLNKTLPKVEIYHVNSLNKNIPSKLNIRVGSMDVAICNPPYLRVKKNIFLEIYLIL